jgi:hypothetical protein
MDQPHYPRFDGPPAYQGYPQGNYNYPPQDNVYHQQANNNYHHQDGLNQHLIDKKHHSDSKHEHKHRRKIKRYISGVIGFVCFAIELGVVYYLKTSAYLFEYCYWKFGLKNYKSNVDQTLPYGDTPGWFYNFYYGIGCDTNSNPYPECSSICDLGRNIDHINPDSVLYAFGTSEVIMLLFIICLISATFSKKPKMKKPVVSCATLLSFTIFLCSLLYFGNKLEILDLPEPDESKVNITSGMDEPSELEAVKGGKILMATLAFMIIYRVLLIFLAKS